MFALPTLSLVFIFTITCCYAYDVYINIDLSSASSPFPYRFRSVWANAHYHFYYTVTGYDCLNPYISITDYKYQRGKDTADPMHVYDGSTNQRILSCAPATAGSLCSSMTCTNRLTFSKSMLTKGVETKLFEIETSNSADCCCARGMDAIINLYCSTPPPSITTSATTTTEIITTTEQPTTMEPTTNEPTTMEPTSVEPTTMQPTTNEPTTNKPTSVDPTTNTTIFFTTTVAAKTNIPTTYTPITIEPTTNMPTTSETTSDTNYTVSMLQTTKSSNIDISTTSIYFPSVIPSVAPTLQYNNLHFVCFYDDDIYNKDYIATYISLIAYADLMVKAILDSVKSTSYQSTNYKEVPVNPLTPWKRAGIINFVICYVFNSQLSPECPSYYDNNVQSQFVSIAIFGIVADNELNEYKKNIIDIMMSNKFKTEFTKNMNGKLNNITQNTLNQHNSFRVNKIEIIDPLNYTMSTTDINQEQEKDNEDMPDTTNIIIIVVVCLIIVIIMSLFIIYFKMKSKNKTIEGEVEGIHINDIELHEHQNQDGPNQDGSNQEKNEVNEGNKENEGNIGNETGVLGDDFDIYTYYDENDEYDKNTDIIDNINKTHGIQNNEDDGDIIATINETSIGSNSNNDNDIDVYSYYDE